MSRRLLDGGRASFDDIPTTMKAAAADVLAEASAARRDLRETATQLAEELRSGAGSVRVHARRAGAIGSEAAREAIDRGQAAGMQAWRDARRHAAEWGSVAISQARSRPGVLLVGAAVACVAIGFWLRGASRRANLASSGARAASARARAPETARRGARKANGRSGHREGSTATSAHE